MSRTSRTRRHQGRWPDVRDRSTSTSRPDSDGTSQYRGPYNKKGQDLYDKAVSCDGNTITFKLNQPRPDFNFTTTLGFSAVPNPTDHPTFTDPGGDGLTGANIWSDGPYKVSQNGYNPVAGGYLKLERNPNWSAASRSVIARPTRTTGRSTSASTRRSSTSA